MQNSLSMYRCMALCYVRGRSSADNMVRSDGEVVKTGTDNADLYRYFRW